MYEMCILLTDLMVFIDVHTCCLVWASLVLFFYLIPQVNTPTPCPLCDYVYQKDSVFGSRSMGKWDLSTIKNYNIPVETYVYNMTAVKYYGKYS